MQSIHKPENYFEQIVPHYIAPLSPKVLPKWGTMNATQMLDHLSDALKLSMGVYKIGEELINEKWEKYKAIGFNSDRPLSKNFTNPIFSLLQKTDNVEHEQAKYNLLQNYQAFKQLFATQGAEFKTIHNMFGKLNYQEWLWFHYKHYAHHFAQFGLIEYVERFDME